MNVPILKQAYQNVEPAALNTGAVDLFDGYLDEVGAFHKRPGLKMLYDFGVTGLDGVFWWADQSKFIVVGGGRVWYSTSPAGSWTEISTATKRLAIGNLVTFAPTGQRLVMSNGNKIAEWTGTGEITVADTRPASSHVAWLNGHVLATDMAEGVVRFTDYAGSLSTLPLVWNDEYFTAEASPDGLLALLIGWSEILLFGPRSIEFWQDTGAAGVPFERSTGSYVERGLSARYSPVSADNTWLFFDHERKIIKLEGRTPKIVSFPYDRLLQNVEVIEDGRGFVLDHWYVLTFPQSGITVAYDLVNGTMARWSWMNPVTGQREVYLGQCACYHGPGGAWIVGGEDGKLYVSHRNLVTDNGNSIHTLLRGVPLDLGTSKLKTAASLTVRMQRGQTDEQGAIIPYGLATDRVVQTGDALQIRWRDEQGAWSNYANVEHGSIEEGTVTATISPMGTYRTRQYELLHSACRDLVLAGLDEDVEPGNV